MNTVYKQMINTSRASCQVLERRHHNRGPNTGSLAPSVRQRAKKKPRKYSNDDKIICVHFIKSIENGIYLY